MTEKNGDKWVVRATKYLLLLFAIGTLVGTIVNVYGSRAFPSKEAFTTLEVHVREDLVTKEALKKDLEPMKKKIDETALKVHQIYLLLLKWDRSG